MTKDRPVIYDLSYEQAVATAATLDYKPCFCLEDHEIVPEGDDSVFKGDTKPWGAVTEITYAGDVEGRAYFRLRALENGVAFRWCITLDYCQAHGLMLLDALPEAVQNEGTQLLRDEADRQEAYALKLEKQAEEARVKACELRRLYRRD